MFSTVSKAVLTGLACGTLGLGIGGVWATRQLPSAEEPMRSLVKPQPVQLSEIAAEVNVGSDATPEPPAQQQELSEAVKLGNVAHSRPKSSDHTDLEASDVEVGAPLSVKRLVVTDRIEGREPGANEELRADGSDVFAFVELSNPATEPQKIEIVFEHESGKQVGFVKLPVPKQKSRWRTWGKTRQISTGGQWVAKVRDESGAELMSQPFVVQG